MGCKAMRWDAMGCNGVGCGAAPPAPRDSCRGVPTGGHIRGPSPGPCRLWGAVFGLPAASQRSAPRQHQVAAEERIRPRSDPDSLRAARGGPVASPWGFSPWVTFGAAVGSLTGTYMCWRAHTRANACTHPCMHTHTRLHACNAHTRKHTTARWCGCVGWGWGRGLWVMGYGWGWGYGLWVTAHGLGLGLWVMG